LFFHTDLPLSAIVVYVLSMGQAFYLVNFIQSMTLTYRAVC